MDIVYAHYQSVIMSLRHQIIHKVSILYCLFFLYITVESYRKRLITSLLCHLYYCILCSILALSGREDVVVVSHGEQMELLNRLDYVLGSITEVKLEVESLRNSLHGLAEDIVGEIR